MFSHSILRRYILRLKGAGQAIRNIAFQGIPLVPRLEYYSEKRDLFKEVRYGFA